MPRQLFVFDPPERFVAGTVGQPGDRTFYLQASGGGRTVSVALEKVQVQLLAERLEDRRQREQVLVPVVDEEDLGPGAHRDTGAQSP